MSSQESRLALPEGYQLHAYRIEGTLGRGGFGVTYEGVEEHTDRRVAIKEYLPAFIAVRSGDGTSVVPAESAAEPDYHWGLDRFRSEARTLLDVRHPNIVPVLQYFEANSTGYLVMEYQQGKALDVVLAPDRVLDADEIDELFLPLLDGLAVVHEAGYLHRDIKLANIFVRRDGRPVLLDFGAARMALRGHSKSLTTIVSEGYAPYEQYESDSQQGPWTDIYGFGATMYRCMTGLKPADAPSRVAAEMHNATDPLTPVARAARKKYPGPADRSRRPCPARGRGAAAADRGRDAGPAHAHPGSTRPRRHRLNAANARQKPPGQYPGDRRRRRGHPGGHSGDRAGRGVFRTRRQCRQPEPERPGGAPAESEFSARMSGSKSLPADLPMPRRLSLFAPDHRPTSGCLSPFSRPVAAVTCAPSCSATSTATRPR